jgi:heptosyltransferase-1
MRPGERVLFVRLSALGDVLDATPVAEAIKSVWPQVELGWVVDRRCAPILRHNPFVDHLHVWDQTVLGTVSLIRELRSLRYEVALDAQGLLKSGLVTRFSGAPQRVGLGDAREGSHRCYTQIIPDRPPYWRVAERALGLLEGIGIEAAAEQFDLRMVTTEGEGRSVDRWLEAAGLHADEFVVLAPATTTPQRHWPPDRWADLATRLRQSCGFRSVLLAGRVDQPLLEAIRAQVDPVMGLVVSAGDMDVRESACAVRQAAAVVALDSYLLHVGLAMKTPTVALFGPTPTERFEREPGLKLVEQPYSCRPCGRRPTCDGRYTCMALITVDDVHAAVVHAVSESQRVSSSLPPAWSGETMISRHCGLATAEWTPELADFCTAVTG